MSRRLPALAYVFASDLQTASMRCDVASSVVGHLGAGKAFEVHALPCSTGLRQIDLSNGSRRSKQQQQQQSSMAPPCPTCHTR